MKGVLGAIALVAFFVGLAFLLRIPEIFGISFGWSVPGVDRGITAVRVLTPKSTDVKSGRIFLARSEELHAAYDFRVESGRARLSVYTGGWLPGGRDLQWFHRNNAIRGPTRQNVRIVAPRSGFYHVRGTLVAASGTFSITWRVEQPKALGRAIRLVSSTMVLLPLLLLAFMLLALGAAVLNARR
jgi:hypothetical protein